VKAFVKRHALPKPKVMAKKIEARARAQMKRGGGGGGGGKGGGSSGEGGGGSGSGVHTLRELLRTLDSFAVRWSLLGSTGHGNTDGAAAYAYPSDPLMYDAYPSDSLAFVSGLLFRPAAAVQIHSTMKERAADASHPHFPPRKQSKTAYTLAR
jgi:hypothetical protein